MSKTWEDASTTLGNIAGGLISNYHPELGTARILYVFVSEPSSKGGHELYGRVKKLSGFNEWALEHDFIIEVASPLWSQLDHSQQTALMDHLLEHCFGEEDEKNGGAMKWRIREPEVREFGTILDRHGAWNTQLAGFVSVAKRTNVENVFNEEETEVNLNDEQVETDVGEV